MPGIPTVAAVTPAEVNAFIAVGFTNSPTTCSEVGPGWAIAHLVATDAMLRPGEIILGPTIFSLCDTALYYAVFTLDGIKPMALTSELSIRFMRPAKGRSFFARADLDHAGRRSVIGTVRVWAEDHPNVMLATAQGTYVLPQ
jgi:acyl-coenzyme A thioesterase PaaI-like protein